MAVVQLRQPVGLALRAVFVAALLAAVAPVIAAWRPPAQEGGALPWGAAGQGVWGPRRAARAAGAGPHPVDSLSDRARLSAVQLCRRRWQSRRLQRRPRPPALR